MGSSHGSVQPWVGSKDPGRYVGHHEGTPQGYHRPLDCSPVRGHKGGRLCRRVVVRLRHACWLALVLGACVHPAAREGRRALDEGAYDLAAHALGKASAAEPTRVDYLVDLGRAEMGRGKPEPAADAFRRASNLEPRTARHVVYLGHALELGRRYEEAERAYRKASELEPDRAWPHRVLGTRLLRWGEPERALAPLERALELEPEHVPTLHARARALVDTGRVADGERAFRQAIERGDGGTDERALRLGLARALLTAARHEQALVEYDEVARRWPRFAPVHVGRAVLLEALGQRDAARQAMRTATQLAPANRQYRAHLARLSAP